jgi:cysteine-S-conjugate beta-lyase
MTTRDPQLHLDETALRACRGVKWDKHGDGVLPAWVADMDFDVPNAVREAVIRSAERSALGYERPEDYADLYAACSRWMGARHGWAPDPATFGALTDLVQGLLLSVHALSEPGDGVIVQGPVYPAFLNSIQQLGRRLADNRLLDVSGAAALDIPDLRALAAEPRNRFLLLCNPHNPSGRVLRADELAAIADIALEHDLTVVSDEIWMDVTYPGHRYVPLATVSPAIAARTVTLTGASKSFNLGGLRCAVAIFGSPALRQRFEALPPRLRGVPNVLALRATTAAWRDGGPWFDAVLRQLDANRQRLAAFVRERLPRVRHRSPEGTYLGWLDFSGLGLDRSAAAFLLEEARVALSDGVEFGGDARCARLNFATTPVLLDAILERMARALG